MPDLFNLAALFQSICTIAFGVVLAYYSNRYLKGWEGRKKEQGDAAAKLLARNEAADTEREQLRRDLDRLQAEHEAVQAKVEQQENKLHQVDIKFSTNQATFAAAKETMARIEDQLGRLIERFMTPRK